MNDLVLLSLLLTVLANLALITIVYFYGKKNINQIFFVLLVLSLTFWGVNNYFSVQVINSNVLFLIRGVMFFATPQTLLLLLFVYTFPNKNLPSKKWLKFLYLSAPLMMLLNFTPLIFSRVDIIDNKVTAIPGPLMPILGLYILLFAVLSLITIIRRYLQSSGLEKIQWRFISTGLFLSFFLMLYLNYFIVLIFNNTNFVKFGHIYHLPIIFTFSYALVRHKMMDIKLIVSQTLAILLSLFLLFEVLSSTDIIQLVINVFVFVFVLIVSVWLVKNVMKEIKQREKLESLTKELQIANERLKELDQAKTDFLSITSHQLRTPLSAIKGYLSMLEEGDFGKLSKKQTDIIGILLRNSERLIRLINIFLNISRIESGRLKIIKSPNDLNRLISDIVKSLQLEADEKHINLDFKPIDLPPLSFDSDKLSDVILNLIDNAIKYTPVGGKVSISVKSKDDYVVLSIHDNGIGIAYEELDQLFEKFRRGKEINKVDTSGNGLGLYIAKIIITGHGGNIWAESEGEHKGSTFKFTLPLLEAEGVDI
jgi:signal transduction histidine kinase